MILMTISTTGKFIDYILNFLIAIFSMTKQDCICDRPNCRVKKLESPFTINYGEFLDKSMANKLGEGASASVWGFSQGEWCGLQAAFKYNEIKDMKELIIES